MDTLENYSERLWKAHRYAWRKINLAHARGRLEQWEYVKLSAMLFEVKRLCRLVDAQIEKWKCGDHVLRPVNPYEKYVLIDRRFKLDEYEHLPPHIQRFMDRVGLVYSLLYSKNM